MRRPNGFVLASLVVAGLLLTRSEADAIFHVAHIDEFMVSYGGDANVQFVEIRMLDDGQEVVTGTKLNAFDASGSFVGTVLTVPGDVASGNQRSWIMGTPQFETASGLQADFEFPAGLPVGGGMICWGDPGPNPTPVLCPTSGSPYVDCVAYGNYTGPTNACIGTPTPLTGEGHSLVRVTDTHDNLADFGCGDPAEPENNARQTVSMPATAACTAVSTTTTTTTSSTTITTTTSTTSTSTTTSSTTTSTTVTTTTSTTTTLPPQACGDATGDGSINATDALHVLRSSVGLLACTLACDVTGGGGVTATDALLLLRFVTGQPVELSCPS
jgi:hypothetical protein